ncbi:MAG: hypothetical protein KDJ14_15435 [Xanthomonadales bacterium]|nr:hypothetical protein [Xanthomonadales bacterium]
MHRVVALTALAWGLGHMVDPDLRDEASVSAPVEEACCGEVATTPFDRRITTDPAAAARDSD